MAQRKKKNRRKKYAPGGIRNPKRVKYAHGGRPMQRNYGGNVQAYLLALQEWEAEHETNNAGGDGRGRGRNNSNQNNTKPIAGSREGYVPRLDEFNPEDFSTMTEAERLAQLMDRGMTEEEARANQQKSLDKGFDINQDGVVTDQEFAALRDAQKTQRAGEPGFDPAKFTSDKRGSIAYDPSAGFTTTKPEKPVIAKTEPITYKTIPNQPIPEDAILDEDKVFIEVPKDEDEERPGGDPGRGPENVPGADPDKIVSDDPDEDDRVGARTGGRMAAPTTGGARPSRPAVMAVETVEDQPVLRAQPQATAQGDVGINPPPTTPITPVVDGVAQGTVQEAQAPAEVEANLIEDVVTVSDQVQDVEDVEGTISEGAIAPIEEQELTERAQAAQRDKAEEQAALAEETEYNISDGAFVDPVTGETAKVAPTKEAEAKSREAITGTPATDGEAAQIIEKVGYEVAKARPVKGTAAKGAAADMVAQVGQLPPELSKTIVEDPATVEAQIDEQPVEVRAAVAALPTEALVSSQMETLLAGLEDGETPVWARSAVAAVEQRMAARGLSASNVARDALFNAIIQSAMPIAQSNAQALQQRAAQNLSNEQQANVQQANLDAQRRLQNTANQQTSASQTAQLAQQMSAMQSQFAQDTMITSAAQSQQARMQNLQNQQQAAIQRSQQQQQANLANLGNEQQMEMANLQFEFQTNRENMSAENMARMQEMQVAADFLAKNAGFKQQMELANLSNDQQMRLANLSALNQASADNLTAEQQTELANLNTRMQTNILQGEIASRMNLAQLSADQQRAVQNAAMVANVDMTKFSADQQVELANSKFMQSMTMTNFNAKQQAAIQNATALASLDLTNANNRTKLAAQNAQAFLQMDMANFNADQQAAILNAQNAQQALLSDQSMQNAAKQFNAQSQNQVDQFNASLAAQIEQFNSQQLNAMSQFNAGQTNAMTSLDKQLSNRFEIASLDAATRAGIAQLQSDTQIKTTGMQTAAQIQATQIGADASISAANIRAQSAASIANAQIQANREQFNAQNAFIASQSALEYERKTAMMNTAAENEMNKLNAQQNFQLTAMDYEAELLAARDEAAYLRQSYENDKALNTQLYIAAIGNETAAGKESSTSIANLMSLVSGVVAGGGGT